MAPRVHGAKTITFTGRGTLPHDVNTDEVGKFSASFTSRVEDSGWSIQAYFAGDAHYKRSESATYTYKTIPSTKTGKKVLEQVVVGQEKGEEVSKEDIMIQKLSNCPTGYGSSRQFESICTNILSHLFSPPLLPAKQSSRTEEGRQIRDIIIHIRHGVENGFWYWIQLYYQAIAIIVECKNYNDVVPSTEITITSQYFNQHRLGNFGLLSIWIGHDSECKKGFT
jgi:hypothetical protein